MAAYKLPNYKGRWYFTFYFEGKKIKKTKWNGQPLNSKNEALAAEYQCKKQLEVEAQRINGNMSLYQLFDEYVSVTKGNLKSTTLARYDSFKKTYISLIKDKNIWELTPSDIVKWKQEIIKLPISTHYKNKKLAVVKNILNYGSTMYNLPGKLQICLLEPVKDYNVAVVNDKRKNLPENEFLRMLGQLNTEYDVEYYYYVVIWFLYYTGLRIGECAALLVSDYDGKSVNVTKDFARVGERNIIQSPKNSNSIRKVLLDRTTIDLLNEYINRFKLTENDVLFHLQGEYLNQQRLRRVLVNLATKTGIKDLYEVHPHALRHSHASNLRLLGYDEYAISTRLGNTPKVAATTYIHSNLNEQTEIISKIESNRTKIELKVDEK